MSLLLAALIALTSGFVTFDTASPGWRSISATTAYKPNMEVVCVERWGDRCKHMKVLTGAISLVEAVVEGLAAVLKTYEHELAHVYDLMDGTLDGRVNGYLVHPWSQELQDTYYSEKSTYNRVCMSNAAETFACETTRTRRLK